MFLDGTGERGRERETGRHRTMMVGRSVEELGKSTMQSKRRRTESNKTTNDDDDVNVEKRMKLSDVISTSNEKENTSVGETVEKNDDTPPHADIECIDVDAILDELKGGDFILPKPKRSSSSNEYVDAKMQDMEGKLVKCLDRMKNFNDAAFKDMETRISKAESTIANEAKTIKEWCDAEIDMRVNRMVIRIFKSVGQRFNNLENALINLSE